MNITYDIKKGRANHSFGVSNDENGDKNDLQ